MRMAGRQILRDATHYQPDLIHAHFAIPGGWVARDLARQLGCGYVVSVHGSDLAFTAKLSRVAGDDVARVLEDASRVVVNSNPTSREVDSLCGRSLGCVPLWQGGDALPRGSKPASNPLRIVSVGHLYANKGYSESARLLGQLRRRGVEFVWTIVGSGTLSDKQRLSEDIRTNRTECLLQTHLATAKRTCSATAG